MKATLEIDGDVLDAVKHLAATERKSVDRVMSDVARRGLGGRLTANVEAMPAVRERNGWIVLTGRSGRVTPELVDDLLMDDDLREPGRLPR